MMDRFEGLWRELVRRRVIRTGAAYAAVSFVILQLGEILLPAFGVGLTGLRTLFAALSAGFPVALAVSWVYDVGMDGLQRTRPLDVGDGGGPVTVYPPSKRILGGVVLSAGALGALGWWLIAGGARFGSVPVNLPSMFLAGTVLLMVGWWSVHEGDDSAVDPSSVPASSIAVLPFVHWGPAEEPRFLGDALAEDVRSQLASVDGLSVVARTFCAAADRALADARSVGRTLGVRMLLEGSLRRSGPHMSVKVRLIDAETGFGEWSGSYRCDVDGYATCLDAIAGEIVDDLLEHLGAQERLVGDGGGSLPSERDVSPTLRSPAPRRARGQSA